MQTENGIEVEGKLERKPNGIATVAFPSTRIELSPAQQQRIKNFQRQIEPLRAQIGALEQGVHAMLLTLIETRGELGKNYSLTEDGTAIVQTEAAS